MAETMTTSITASMTPNATGIARLPNCLAKSQLRRQCTSTRPTIKVGSGGAQAGADVAGAHSNSWRGARTGFDATAFVDIADMQLISKVSTGSARVTVRLLAAKKQAVDEITCDTSQAVTGHSGIRDWHCTGDKRTSYAFGDDSLFRSAIMESGNSIIDGAMDRSYEATSQNLSAAACCSNATDALQCLRELPFPALNVVVNMTQSSGVWTPQIDGGIISRYSSDQIAESAFVKVPVIVGAKSDDGTSFAPRGLNTSQQSCKP
ncbi:hypothetical protein BU25DRAFT_480896 [Macroventuria anomochaeta]|uniref:Uncharacterized protein n=1 Tax=Macroventuria anomochaeta TaxID=301207 RepID=A0ACB6RMB3_9PLEO|nr:uncharacterized protein BU25DRAFT_480896 [Macroventuria anomochaeta]KAF2622304.1 hypothetical protein BU25DRAFT_480896 [Macroventuria anomochaeta]